MSETKPEVPVGGEDEKSKSALKKEQKKLEKEKKIAEAKAKRAAEQQAKGGDNQQKKKEEVVENNDNFGKNEMNNSKVLIKREWTTIGSLDESKVGQKVLIRARISTSRLQGANLCFITLREKLYTVQAVVAKGAVCSKSMVKFAGEIPRESIVDIEGTVSKTNVPIESCSQKNVELHVTSLFIVSEAQQLPLLLEDLSRNQAILDQQDNEIAELTKQLESTSITEQEKEELTAKKSAASRYVNVGLSQRLQHRYLDLRVPANLSIFRIQSAVCSLFRDYLLKNEFTEIHSPKMISAASESGASVFKLGYFNTNAYLAQSPQFYKQMAIASDFDRVFEIAPVFRAENSNTHRHLTEFVGLDMEMAFKDHYHEVLDTLEEMMLYIFEGLETKFQKELETINAQYPFEPFKFSRPSPRLTFDEAAKLLGDEAEALQDETYIVKNNDFSTRQEKKLGQIIKKKYGVDFFIVDKFHTEVRPFYTMPDPNNPGLANAYDLFMRGEEICSGAQRIHDSKLLEENAKHHGINIADIQAYIDSFKYGCSQHAGGGVGLERVVMLYLGIFNIRKTSLFPRDPQILTP